MAPQESLSYDEIHSIQKRERSTRSLTKVSHDFYERLAAYVADAGAGLADETAKGQSPRLLLLQGQFRNLQEMARDILLLRLRKVTELAFSAVEGGALNEKVMTPEELSFLKQVQSLVEATRASAARLAQPEPSAPALREIPLPQAPAPPRANPAPGPAAEAPRPNPAPAAPTREPTNLVVLRIIADVAPFEGDDNRVYKLQREDVITLPRNLAQILLRRKAAVELEVPP